MISRRSFLGSLLCLPLVPKVESLPKAFNYKPYPAQEKFLNSEGPINFYGVPYHQSNASTGQWLGFSRG